MNYDRDIACACDVMRCGGVIIYPTDTVWGIGCDATNAAAVAKIYAMKRREDGKAMICLVDSADRLSRYVRDVPTVAWDIIEYATRPTTLILDRATGLAPNLMAADGSIAMRVTGEAFSKGLCYRLQRPVVSTSANISGEPPASCYDDIAPELLAAADYVCTSRRREKSLRQPSAIIRLRPDGEVQIVRR